MTVTHEARFISVSIERDWRAVYEFCRVPENFARWAAGMGSSLAFDGSNWTVDTPRGKAIVRFAAPNDDGVLDHTLLFPGGTKTYNPLRVVANGSGAEVTFTLFRQPDMSDRELDDDAAAVARDLQTLKTLLEA